LSDNVSTALFIVAGRNYGASSRDSAASSDAVLGGASSAAYRRLQRETIRSLMREYGLTQG